MTSLITINVANDACIRNLRTALALAAYLRRLGCQVEVVIDSWQESDCFVLPAAA